MGLPKNYYNYFDICKWEGIPTGTAKSAVGEEGLKGIAGIEKLKPIAHLFREFEKGDMRKSYGILKKHYDYWKRTGKPPKVSPGRPPRWKNDPTYCNINIPIKRDLWERFKRMVDNANAVSVVKISYRDMIYVALEEAIQRRPQFAGGDDDGEQKQEKRKGKG